MPKNEHKIEARKKKVLKEKLKDPTASQEELAKRVGTSRQTVQRDLKYLGENGQLKDISVMNAIKDADLEIVIEGQKAIIEKILLEKDKITARDLSAVTKDSQVRYSFLAGENAKKDGGEKRSLLDLSDDELEALTRGGNG